VHYCFGKEPNVLLRIIAGEKIGTKFTAIASSVESRKRYILSARRAPGMLKIDEGAVQALRKGGSLLPVGMVAVHGTFGRGDTVRIAQQDGTEIARGIV